MNAVLKLKQIMGKEDVAMLCHAWMEAKKKEAQAKDARVLIEEKLKDALRFDKPEGSKTIKQDGYKVVFKSGFNYRIDKEAWAEVEGRIPDGMRPVKYKLEVDEKGAKYLRDNEPELWALAAKAITVTPAKLNVAVEKTEE